MRVRIYDKDMNRYFRSDVYAIINAGRYSRFLVLVPSDRDYYRFYDYFDLSQGGPPYPVNINMITPEIPFEWVQKNKYDLIRVQRFLRKLDREVKIENFQGYSWLPDEAEALAALVAGQIVYADETQEDHKAYRSAEGGWYFVEKQEDIGDLLDRFNYFHDSALRSLYYVSGSEAGEDGSLLCSDVVRQVTMTFDSQWSKPVEMVFEGVLALNLRPAQDDYSSRIDCASIFLNDEVFFFCDGSFQAEPPSYAGTWIKSFGLKWRYE